MADNERFGAGLSYLKQNLRWHAEFPRGLEQERYRRFDYLLPEDETEEDDSDDDAIVWPEGIVPRTVTTEKERHDASKPQHQWSAAHGEEREWLLQMKRRTVEDYLHEDLNDDFERRVSRNVKSRWKEQGIWREEWERDLKLRWAHEEPFDAESGTGTQRNPEHGSTLHPGRDASRPFYQFLYQLSVERGRIRAELDRHEHVSNWHDSMADPSDKSFREKSPIRTPADINTSAYERVKKRWVERGIWYRKWGEHMPGMKWKHEFSLEEVLREEAEGENYPIFETSLASYTSEVHDQEAWLRLYPKSWLPTIPPRPRNSETQNTGGATTTQSLAPDPGPGPTRQPTPASAVHNDAGSSAQDTQASRAPPVPSEASRPDPAGAPETSPQQRREAPAPPAEAPRPDTERPVETAAPSRRSRRLQQKVEAKTTEKAADTGDVDQQPKLAKSRGKRTEAASAAADDVDEETKAAKSPGKRAAPASATESSGRPSKKRNTGSRK